jgi:hypothetical protein
MYACLECGRKFRTTTAAERAANHGCPKCGGVDIDLDTGTGTGSRPPVQLVGRDGNAFAILAACRSAARKAGWPDSRIKQFEAEAMSGDYDALLRTAMRYFDVQ